MADLLTVREIASLCQLHEMTVRRHIREGRLKAVRVGKGVRVRSADLEAYLTSGEEARPATRKDIHVQPFTRNDPLFALAGLVHAPDAAALSGDKYAAFPAAYAHDS